MGYSYRLFDSIDEVDLAGWQRILSQCTEPVFMDPRLIAAVEASMTKTCRFWHVIVYDEAGASVACASLTSMTIDLLNHADPGLASIIRRLPGVLSRLRHPRILICGLPLSAGQKNLEFTSPSDGQPVLSLLDRVITELASKTKMDIILYKEFGDEDMKWVSPLLGRGYRRIPTLPTHFFTPAFENFQHYCAAVRSHYRRLINRSTRKLRDNGLEISVLNDTKEILDAYTPEVHSLYYQVVAKAEFKLEILPIEFFHELTKRLADQVDLVTIRKGGRILAFVWCLKAGSICYLLFIGLDYELNPEFDLYFNMFYAALDCALRKRGSKIVVGQTSEGFKARLGCYSEPLYAFVKGVGPLMSLFIRLAAGFLVAQKPKPPPAHVFRRDDDASSKPAAP